MPTASELLDSAERRLIDSELIDHPHRGKERFDAEEILAFVLGVEDLDPEAPVPPSTGRRFERLIERRASGEPAAYITGSTEFFGMHLDVARGAFIPRESSEWLAEQAIRRLRRRRRPVHVDLGTGIGPVALAVGSKVPASRVFGVDISASPVRQATANARRLGLRHVRFLRGDLFEPLQSSLRGEVDVITIHPPYVPRRELRDLPDEIARFEPEESLTDYSPLGDRIFRRVSNEAPSWLRSGGWLLVEVSPDRAREVATALRRGGFVGVRSTAGPVRVTRVIVGRAA
jgi:release factor glutamine methyltransferase